MGLAHRLQRPWTWLAGAALSLVLVGCAAGPGGPAGPSGSVVPTPASAAAAPSGPGIGPVPTTTPAADPPDADFPVPDQVFAEHFADPLYHDLGEELAPFGSDEGFDTLYSWQQHPQDLTGCTTVRSMFDAEDSSLASAMEQASGDDPAADGAIVGVGFTLLFFTGHIDPDGKELVLAAVRREAAYYEDDSIRAFPVLLRDLDSFPATACGSATPVAS